MKYFLMILMAFSMACSSDKEPTEAEKKAKEAKQDVSAEKDDEKEKPKGTDQNAGCSDDLKALSEWVLQMNKDRKAGKEPDMTKGQDLLTKLKQADKEKAFSADCKNRLVSLSGQLSGKSQKTQASKDGCLKSCASIKVPPKRIACQNACK